MLDQRKNQFHQLILADEIVLRGDKGKVKISQMTVEVQKIYFPDRKAWRAWLNKNHDKVKSIWLVHDKFREANLSYDDIVEEALCFGWIDSTLKRLNEKQNMIYLSVRKPKSIWAASNKARVEKLLKSGLMRPAGVKVIEAAKKDRSWNAFDAVEELIAPKELKEAFEKNEKVKEGFDKLTNSQRKQVLYFIYSAKQEVTRIQRVERLLPALIQGKNPFT